MFFSKEEIVRCQKNSFVEEIIYKYRTKKEPQVALFAKLVAINFQIKNTRPKEANDTNPKCFVF